jgi:hypothetical protein
MEIQFQTKLRQYFGCGDKAYLRKPRARGIAAWHFFLDEVFQGGKASLQPETDRPQSDGIGQHYVPALHLLTLNTS